MKIKRPWWHALVVPFLHWRADLREKREAKARLERYILQGYFVGRTNWVGTNGTYSDWSIAAYKNGHGERRLEPLIAGDRSRDNPVWAIAKAWAGGDDRMNSYLRAEPVYHEKAKWPSQPLSRL